MPATLPAPSPEEAEHSERLRAQIADTIRHAGGWISFAQYMQLALYAPALGYYTGGRHQLGADGDFITAPEATPLFGECIATQLAEVLPQTEGVLIEAGAGSGALAASVLLALERLGCLPAHYDILEVSPSLMQRQQEHLRAHAPHLLARVRWLQAPPERFSGVLLANEVLDAMPVHRLRCEHGEVREDGVALDANGQFCWQARPLSAVLREAAADLPLPTDAPVRTELARAARDWVRDWSRRLDSGLLLLIDYGYPRDEYYLPARADGTLACYYRHRMHADPFWLPGLSDITASVDFTAVAEAAFDSALDILGFTSQAAFLFNCGLAEHLARHSAAGERAHFAALRGAQRISDLREMGETFKVFAAGRGIAPQLCGFARHDRTHAL